MDDDVRRAKLLLAGGSGKCAVSGSGGNTAMWWIFSDGLARIYEPGGMHHHGEVVHGPFSDTAEIKAFLLKTYGYDYDKAR